MYNRILYKGRAWHFSAKASFFNDSIEFPLFKNASVEQRYLLSCPYLIMGRALQALAALLVCCLPLLLHFTIKVNTSRLKSLPGPFPGRVSNFYRVWLLSTGKGPIKYWELHKKYGPVVRTGPNHVSLSDPAMISVVYDLKNKYFKVSYCAFE